MTDDMVAPNAAEWQGMTDDRRAAIIEGEEAITVHRQGLARVFAIGKAFEAMQQEAMERAHSQDAIGKRYNEAYARLEKPVPELARINKTDRNQYIWCWSVHEALESWWQDKAKTARGLRQRDKWNHPDAIKRNYLADHGQGRGPDGTAAKSPSPMQKQKDAVVQLEGELATAHKEIQRLKRGQDNLTEGRDWTWQDRPEDIAAAWFRLYPSKSLQIASKVLELGKATTPKPRRAKRQSEPKGERHWDEPEPKPAKPPKPEPPAWCRTDDPKAQRALLRPALVAAGEAGLHEHDVYPLELDKTARNRGIKAWGGALRPQAPGVPPIAIERDGRLYLNRFALDSAADEAEPDDEPIETPQPVPASPIAAALRKAGSAGLSAFELMQAAGLDAVALFPVLKPLLDAGSVVVRDGRYYDPASAAG
jgi:hypothetical protein